MIEIDSILTTAKTNHLERELRELNMEQRPILQNLLRNRNPKMNSHVNSTRFRAPDYHSLIVEAGPTTCSINDGTSSKPNGREVAEVSQSKEKNLINYKTYRQISTLNRRTLRENWKRK